MIQEFVVQLYLKSQRLCCVDVTVLKLRRKNTAIIVSLKSLFIRLLQ